MDEAELEKIAKTYARTDAALSKLRPDLYAGIYEYKQAHGQRRGWQGDLVRMTGFTRERIRQIIALEEKRRSDESPDGGVRPPGSG